MIHDTRNRTKLNDIACALHLYFNGLSLRNTSKALSRFVKKSHTAIRDCWIQKYKPKKLHIHSAYEKSIIIERTIQYIKDRTENFDDYFPCRMKNCKLKHVTNWLKLFAHFYNVEAISLTLQSLFYYVRLLIN